MGSVGLGPRGTGRAVFLDRDGVINKNVFYPQRGDLPGEWESPQSPEEVVIAAGAIDALLALEQAGYLLIVVSNQPNAAKGKATVEMLDAIHRRVYDLLKQAGVRITQFYYCYHHPEGVVPSLSTICDCRKPSPYFLRRAATDFGLDLAQCWMVGDRDSDVDCGLAAGVRTIRVLDELNHGSDRADYNVANLSAATEIILRDSASS